MGAEQKALQVRQSDVNPGEETVRRLVLGGDSRGGVFKAFLLQAAITAPAVGENMAPCCDFGGEEFLHRCGGGIRNHFQSGKSRNGLCRSGSEDRKSTRLNSSHQIISYAGFCLKKKQRSHIQSVLVSSEHPRP